MKTYTNLAWNAIIAAWMIENRPDLDDRLKFTNDDLQTPVS